MKEKTFEELLTDDKDFAPDIFGRETVLKLLQQVREATKSEVLTLCDENFFSKEPKGKLMENIENLPTDRIKINE